MPDDRRNLAGHRWATPGLRLKLASLVVFATAAVLAVSAYTIVRFQRDQLLNAAIEAGSTESDALRVVLEEQMMAGDRTLLRRLMIDMGREPSIHWVGLLDSDGRVQVSSDEASVGQVFDLASPDCQVCHAHKAAERSRSVTLVRPAGGLLRTVTPLLNRKACHRCHDPEARINGVLIVDRSLQPLEEAVLFGRHQLLVGSLAVLIAIIGSLGIGFEGVVLLRLRRLRRATQELGRGAGWKGVRDRSADELGELSRDFNAMAARLAAERRQLEGLINGLADGVVLVDREMRVVTTNRAFAERFPGTTMADAGSNHRELARLAGFDASGPLPAERALNSRTLEKEIFRIGPPGEERYDEVYAQILRGPDGEPAGAVEVWRDITERKALEAGLEQSERLAALGMMASSVAHEVGNPLASIATAVEGLLLRLDESAEVDLTELREYLAIVRHEVFRCHGVTERLLGFARVPPGRPAIVDAAARARDVIALVAPQARSQGVILRTSLDSPTPVLAEDLLLEQVFLNLTLNALQAMPRGGELHVGARIDGDHVVVVVEDTGPGIPEAVRRRIFEPFQRGRRDGMGTGLGLFISLALVQRCGGSLSVASEEGRGTAFTVRLRRSPGSPAARERPPAEEEGNGSSDRGR